MKNIKSNDSLDILPKEENENTEKQPNTNKKIKQFSKIKS